MATVTLGVGAMVVRAWPLGMTIEFSDSPFQVAVSLFVIVAAIAAAFQERRIAAVFLLGAVGYGVAILFVMYGAPDLALTQILFETLALVLFVLVLRHLPDRFRKRQHRFGQTSRLIISIGLGTFVGVFALVAVNARVTESIGFEMAARALPDTGARNVVNVILTDFRALDTLGEITVLLVVAIGIATLVGQRLGDR